MQQRIAEFRSLGPARISMMVAPITLGLFLACLEPSISRASPPLGYTFGTRSTSVETCARQAAQILEAGEFFGVKVDVNKVTRTHFVVGESREASALVICTPQGKKVEVTIVTAVATRERVNEYLDWFKYNFNKLQ